MGASNRKANGRAKWWDGWYANERRGLGAGDDAASIDAQLEPDGAALEDDLAIGRLGEL
jgi:hypothetical protein